MAKSLLPTYEHRSSDIIAYVKSGLWPHGAVTPVLWMVETGRLPRTASHQPNSRSSNSKESEIEGDRARHPTSSSGLCKRTSAHTRVYIRTHRNEYN